MYNIYKIGSSQSIDITATGVAQNLKSNYNAIRGNSILITADIKKGIYNVTFTLQEISFQLVDKQGIAMSQQYDYKLTTSKFSASGYTFEVKYVGGIIQVYIMATMSAAFNIRIDKLIVKYQ